MADRNGFFDVLTQAIRDLSEHGFDSVERVEMWTARLREAARASLTPEAQVESILREGLATIYRRLVEQGGIARFNPGVARFTIERVKPKLRAELDRRIVASADLIKRNRAEAIEKTLHRFQGWATSVPAGGSEAVEKNATKAGIKKALGQLPFEERRVIIDTSAKMTAALSNILAVNSNAIAMRWSSQWRRQGYNYRVEHKERDGKIYLLKGNWAQEKGLVKVGAAGYLDDITKPAEEVFCSCGGVYIHSLRDLPANMLTEKGRQELARVRAQLKAGPLAAPGTFA